VDRRENAMKEPAAGQQFVRIPLWLGVCLAPSIARQVLLASPRAENIAPADAKEHFYAQRDVPDMVV